MIRCTTNLYLINTIVLKILNLDYHFRDCMYRMIMYSILYKFLILNVLVLCTVYCTLYSTLYSN